MRAVRVCKCGQMLLYGAAHLNCPHTTKAKPRVRFEERSLTLCPPEYRVSGEMPSGWRFVTPWCPYASDAWRVAAMRIRNLP